MEYILSTVCSGIGSPEFAAEELSAETEFKPKQGFYCEINKFARASYEAMFGTGLFIEDMTKAEWEGPEFYSDVFIGGIPCQAFSLAGLRKGELDPRGLLFYDFYRYVKKQQPKVFIIENVKGLLSDSNGKTFQNWLLMLGDSVNGHMQMFNHELSLGYNLHWTVLNTKDFGIPQNRERVFIVGIRPDLPNSFRFPVGFPLKLRLKDILEPVVDEKYYLSDKMINCLTNHSDNMKSNGHGFKTSFLDVNIVNIVNTVKSNYGKMPGDAHYISEPILISNSDTNRKLKVEKNVPPLRSHEGCGHDNITLEINNKSGLTQFGTSQDSKLSPLNGLSQTISSGHFNQPKIILDCIGNLNQTGHNESLGRIYSAEGLAPTVTAKQGGGHEPKIVTSRLSSFKESENAIRGIKADGSGLQEHFYNKDTGTAGTAGTISSSHKPKVIIKEATKKGFDIATDGDSIQLQNPKSKIRRGRVGKEIANTIETLSTQATISNHRIRRLTPLECWRLQGFSDVAFYKAKEEGVISSVISLMGTKHTDMKKAVKGMSDSQLYKQAGNSMTTKVIKAILKNILFAIFTPSP